MGVARKQFFRTAQFLIDNGASMKERDNQGRTVLHASIVARSLNAVKFLLSLGRETDVDLTNDMVPVEGTMSTPLHLALRYSPSMEMISLLLDYGVEMNGRGAYLGHGAMCVCRDDDDDDDGTDAKGITPLMMAARQRDPAILAYLLKRGASWGPILYSRSEGKTL